MWGFFCAKCPAVLGLVQRECLWVGEEERFLCVVVNLITSGNVKWLP